FLLTGDPYAIEEMQFAVIFNTICKPPNDRGNYSMGGALRAHAWALRAMAHAAKISPDNPPKWLLPRSNFQQMLDGNRDFVAGYANSTETLFAKLHCLADPRWGAPPETYIPPDCANAPWWEDYEQVVQGHVVELGFDDWRPNYEWHVRNIVDRCSTTSGWNRSSAFPYKIAVRPAADQPFATDWADCWKMNCASGNCVEADPAHLPPSTDIAYPQEGLACLAMAVRFGIDGAAAAHDWLAAELATMFAQQTYIYARWSIG